MSWNLVRIENVFYDKQQEHKDKENNKKEKYLANCIDEIINILIDNLSFRSDHNNGEYIYSKNGISSIFTYKTNIFGDYGRYEINITKPTDCNSSHVYFNYFHGHVFQFVGFMDSKDTYITRIERTRLKILVDIIIDISLNTQLSNRILNKINKLISKINRFIE